MFHFFVKEKGFIKYDSLVGHVNYTPDFFLSLAAYGIEEREKVLSDFCSGDDVFIYEVEISERNVITSNLTTNL